MDRRSAGQGLDRTLASFTGASRQCVLAGYVDAALRLREAAPPTRDFGELLADGPVRRDAWPAFLWHRAAQSLADSLPDLRTDLLGVDNVIARFHGQLALVADVREPALVHGDYFPGNVIADGDRVAAVIDFGPLTVAGGWRMNAAGALCFLDVVRAADAADAAFVRARLAERAPEALPVLALYRTYYALYFSFTKRLSPRIHDWCLRSLASAAASR